MAKKRFGGFGRRTKSVVRYAKRVNRSRRFAPSNVKLIQLDAMIYGGVRQFVSDKLQPVTAMIPLGNISDEVVMGGVNYLLAKNTSGMIKDIATKGLIIENARLGEAVVQGGLGGLFGSAAPQTSNSQSW